MDINLTQPQTQKKTIRLFIAIFLCLSAAALSIALLFYIQERDQNLTERKTQESYALKLLRRTTGEEFTNIVGDLFFLSHQNELRELLTNTSANPVGAMEYEYLKLAAIKRMYDQIRYLDNRGMERVRVNYNSGKPIIVEGEGLQDKSDRYYFKDSIALDENQIYVSQLDLNVEHGQVETPLKPMIRFGTPIFDAKGQKQGVLILNYLADHLLDRIISFSETSGGDAMLLNFEGYWLLSPNKDDEWGFMLDDRKERFFGRDYPAEWQAMLQDKEGQMLTDNGLFTFTTIYPTQMMGRASTGDVHDDAAVSVGNCSQGLFWVLASHVPPDALEAYPKRILNKLIIINAAMLLLLGVGTWQLAVAIIKRKMYQQHLIALALYDALTGLPNRKMFFDQLEKDLERAERHERILGLLYIDLDGFKQVNDTKGHEAGDELLILVGRRMKSCIRKTDIVARLGGDEFAVLLPEITDRTGATTTGAKIIESLSHPFELKSGPATIGASIGAAVYPEHDLTVEGLVKLADQAMYQAKARGKNICVMSGE